MAVFQGSFLSQALRKNTYVTLILPNDAETEITLGNRHYERRMKTIYLLHGFSGNAMDWLIGSCVQGIALKYNLAVIMPTGDNSFYLDGKGSGRSYGSFIGEELIAYSRKTFGLSDQREDTLIGGLSMGGFGAIRNGLKYHSVFGGIAALSSALIVSQIKNQCTDFRNDIADYDYYRYTFGELDKLEKSENNPEYLVRKLVSEKKALPQICMACGTEDSLLEENREFSNFLQKEGVKATYLEGQGKHDWNFWNAWLEPLVKILIE